MVVVVVSGSGGGSGNGSRSGWESVWRKYSRPHCRKDDGTKIKLEVKDFVPYLPSKDGAVPAAVGVPFNRKSAAGNGEPALSRPTRTPVSVPGVAEDDDAFSYAPSVLDDGESQGFYPGELYPGPRAATAPDPSAVSDEEHGEDDELSEDDER